MKKVPLINSIHLLCRTLEQEFDSIPYQRKRKLMILSDYLAKKFKHQETPKVIVICTHNSRRSHLGQIWLAVAANYYDLPKIETFSGGTEATAFNPRAVAALQRVGFQIDQNEFVTPTNPIYEIKWSIDQVPYLAFSKKYDTPPNPTEKFAAIMVCTEADKGCPIIPNVELRLPLPYDDPKAFDDTLQEAAKYDERCRQIGREILFVFSHILL